MCCKGLAVNLGNLVALVLLLGLLGATAVGAPVTSTFDTGTDGWTWVPTMDRAFSWQSSGGNPGGYIRYDDNKDTGGRSGIFAPSKYLGDWKTPGITTLTYETKIFTKGSVYKLGYYQVWMSGPGGFAKWIGPRPDASAGWLQLNVPINASDWTMQSGSWDDLLSDVTELYIHMEYYNNWGPFEIIGVDNVYLDKAPLNANTPPVAMCQDVVAEAGDGCVAEASIDNGSYDPDGDAVTISQTPAGPYPLGDTTVTLTVTDEHGAADTCVGIVTVIDTVAPTLSASATPQEVSVGQEVSFVATVDDECDSTVLWDFGDGDTSTDLSTTHSYASCGKYTAIVYACDSSGNLSTKKFTIVVSCLVNVIVDIKPGSCPNPFNAKSKGSVPVAIVGTLDFDPANVDLSTILLQGVSPVNAAMDDSTQPGDYDPADCYNCFEADGSYLGDGIYDLVLHFDTQELAAAIGEAERDDCIELTLTGKLLDGTPIEGSDSIVIKSK